MVAALMREREILDPVTATLGPGRKVLDGLVIPTLAIGYLHRQTAPAAEIILQLAQFLPYRRALHPLFPLGNVARQKLLPVVRDAARDVIRHPHAAFYDTEGIPVGRRRASAESNQHE